MKKVAIFSIMIFYLFLSTDVYACFMHCSAKYLIASTHKLSSRYQKKHCTKSKACDCCKNHGSFSIKENIKPGFVFQFSKIVFINTKTLLSGFLLDVPTINNEIYWAENHSPPSKSGRMLLTEICSLQI